VSIDFFKSLNVVVLNKSTELGEGSPFLVVSSSSGGTAVLATTATTLATTNDQYLVVSDNLYYDGF
jgi:hypothetical protein